MTNPPWATSTQQVVTAGGTVTEDTGWPQVPAPEPEPEPDTPAEPPADSEPQPEPEPAEDVSEPPAAPEPEPEPPADVAAPAAPEPEWLIEVRNNAPGILGNAIVELYNLVTGK